MAGSFVGLTSVFLRPSYDETFWLGVTRLVENGATLYDGAVDNKTPPVYLAMWLLDLAPGPFRLARGILVGVLVAWAALSLSRLLGARRSHPVVLAAISVAIASASGFVVTLELVAVTLLLAALDHARRGQWPFAVFMGASAAVFDPRAVVLFAGLVAALPDRALRGRAAVGLGGFTAVSVAVVLSIPLLRFGLVELNLASRATRGAWDLPEVFTTAVVAWTAFSAPLAIVRLRALGAAGWTLLVGALVIGFGSLHPFVHYWTYLAVVLPFAVGEPRSAGPWRNSIAVLMLVPITSVSIASGLVQQREWDRYRPVAAAVGEDETVFVWDRKPYAVALLADRTVMASPTVQYLAWETSRQDEFTSELISDFPQVTTVLDTGGLLGPSEGLSPELTDLKPAVAMLVTDAFDCISEFDGVTIRRRNDLCARGATG